MIVLIDTDVLIDVALDRTPHAGHSAKILDLVQKGYLEAWIAWHSLSNFYYIVLSENQRKKTLQFMEDLLRFVRVSETGTDDAVYALKLGLPDFEDALQVAAGQACRAQYIITRNIRHYNKSPVPAESPRTMLQSLDMI